MSILNKMFRKVFEEDVRDIAKEVVKEETTPVFEELIKTIKDISSGINVQDTEEKQGPIIDEDYDDVEHIYAIASRGNMAIYIDESNNNGKVQAKDTQRAALEMLIYLLQKIQENNRTNNTIVVYDNLANIIIDKKTLPKDVYARDLWTKVFVLKEQLNNKVKFVTCNQAKGLAKAIKSQAWDYIDTGANLVSIY
jgi:hypothetical protein